jgi:hypothetical protein
MRCKLFRARKILAVCCLIFAMLFFIGCSQDNNSFANNGNSDENDNDQSSIGALGGMLGGLVDLGVSIDLNYGLVAYYPFNGDADDESGNGNNGIVKGATLAEDRFGNADSAYHFNGSSSGIYSNVGNELSLSNVTLAAWINIEGHGSYNPRIVSVSPSGSSFAYYALIVEYERIGYPSFPLPLAFMAEYDPNNNSLFDLYPSASKLSNNNGWHHVAVTYNGSNVTFYVDGIADPALSASHSSLVAFSSAVLNIGHSDNGLDRFDGDIDEVRVYNRALSAIEILELYLSN